MPFKKYRTSCCAIAKLVPSKIDLSLIWSTQIAKVFGSSSTLGKSVAGSVARINLLLPHLTVSFESDRETSIKVSSGSDLHISSSFLAGTVTDPGMPLLLTSAVAISSTSRSVPVIDSDVPSKTSNTLDKTGRVCLRSITPLTICNGRSNDSLVMTNCI